VREEETEREREIAERRPRDSGRLETRSCMGLPVGRWPVELGANSGDFPVVFMRKSLR
jgi:hypothetical protein